MTEQETSAKLKARIGLFQGYMEDAAFVEAPAHPTPAPIPAPAPIPILSATPVAVSAPSDAPADPVFAASTLLEGIDISSAAVSAAVQARLAMDDAVDVADRNAPLPLEVEWEPPRTSSLSGWVPADASTISASEAAVAKYNAQVTEQELREEARRLAEAMARKAAAGTTMHAQVAGGDFPMVTPSGVFRNSRNHAHHVSEPGFETRRVVEKKEKMSNFLFSFLTVVLLGILCTIVVLFLIDPKM